MANGIERGLGGFLSGMASGINAGVKRRDEQEQREYQRKQEAERMDLLRQQNEREQLRLQREIQRQDEYRPGELAIQQQTIEGLRSQEGRAAETHERNRSKWASEDALKETMREAYAQGREARGQAIRKSILPVEVEGPTQSGKGLPDAYQVGANTYLDKDKAYAEAEKAAGSVFSFINTTHADQVRQKALEAGDQVTYEKYGKWLELEGTQEGVRHFANGVTQFQTGNVDGAVHSFQKAFNAKGYLQDGTSVNLEDVKRDSKGVPTSVDLTFTDQAGKTHKLNDITIQELWNVGTNMLSPDKVFERGVAEWDAMKKAQAEAQAAQAKTQGEQEARAAAARSAGYQPGTREYHAYVLTGKLAGSDQQPLTATDRKAILEADEGIAANQATITNLREAQRLSPQANSGPGASTRAAIGNMMPDYLLPDFISSPQSSAATAQLENLSTGNALEQLKAIFGAAPTEGERKILLDIQGAVNQPDHVRQDIYRRAQAAAERRLAFNEQRANELRGGTYYRPRGGQQQQRSVGGVDPQAVIQQARDAVARGADPAAVMGRLREMGFDLGE